MCAVQIVKLLQASLCFWAVYIKLISGNQLLEAGEVSVVCVCQDYHVKYSKFQLQRSSSLLKHLLETVL